MGKNQNDLFAGIDFVGMLRSLCKRWLVILLSGVATGALGVFVALRVAPAWTSECKFIMQSSEKTSGKLELLTSMMGVGSSESNSSAYAKELLTSSDFLDVLLARKWEVKDSSRFHCKECTIARMYGYAPDTTLPDWQLKQGEDMRKIVSENLVTFNSNKETGITSIGITIGDPKAAYGVNRFILDTLNDILTTKTKSKARANRIFIGSMKNEAEAALASAERRLAEFKANNLFTTSPVVSMREKVLEREQNLRQSSYIQIAGQYEMARIEEFRESPALEIIDSPRIPYSPNPSKKKLIVIGAAAGGFMIAAMVVLLLAWLRGPEGDKKGIVK